MNGVYTIALNTFRESIRNKVFASLGLFAVGILAVVAAMSRASLNEEIRLMKDLGLFLVSTFSVVIAVFVGVNLLYQEIERKTIYTVVPKPIHCSGSTSGWRRRWRCRSRSWARCSG